MYFRDHNPPNFHAEYQGQKAEYSIQTLEIIGGKLPSRAQSMVLERASLHREELMNIWSNATIPTELLPIEPLN